ncbi:MAG: ATP-binding protein [Desulfitobacterium sp.]
MRSRISLRKEVFIYAMVIGFTPLFLTVWILQLSINQTFEKRIERESIDIAIQVSNNINVINTFSAILPDRELLQKVANDLRDRSGAHVVFLDIYGKSLIDPYPPNYGLQVIGKEKGRALKGETYTMKVDGSTGRAIRAFAPIINDEGRQKGVVVVAFLDPDIRLIISQVYESTSKAVPLAVIFIVALSSILARNIKKKLFGMEPIEIAKLLSERENLLQSVDEAIIATNINLMITVANEAAHSLFPDNTVLIGEDLSDLIPEQFFLKVTENKFSNKQLLINGKVILANSSPLLVNKKVVGTVVTLRNRTEIQQLAEELTGVQKMVQALRSKTHDFSNKLHVIYGLLQHGHYEEAEKYVDRLSNEKSLINTVVNNIQDITIRELLLGKASEAEERKIHFTIDSESFLFELPETFDVNSMVVVMGNLIDNAFDAVEIRPESSSVFISIRQDENKITLTVKDNGNGIPVEYYRKLFQPGFTTKMKGTGYGLYNVNKQVNFAKGTITCDTDNNGTSFLITIPYSILKNNGGNFSE